MTPDEFTALTAGDILHNVNGLAYLVTDTYAEHVSVTPVLCVDDADLWSVAVKAADATRSPLEPPHHLAEGHEAPRWISASTPPEGFEDQGAAQPPGRTTYTPPPQPPSGLPGGETDPRMPPPQAPAPSRRPAPARSRPETTPHEEDF